MLKHSNMMGILIIAIAIRLIITLVTDNSHKFPFYDSYEYYYNSVNLEVWQDAKIKLGYDNWYERTPAYVLFLHIVHPQNALIVQIILSSLGVLLMYKMNKLAGWIWCFYPTSIYNASQYAKETLYIFIIICLIYTLRKHYYSTS